MPPAFAVDGVMNLNNSFKHYIFALMLGVFGAFAGAFAPLLLVPILAWTALIGTMCSLSCASVSVAFTVAGIALARLDDPLALVCLSAAYLVCALTIIIGFRRKLAYRYIALICACALFIGLYAYTGLAQLAAGKPPYAGLLQRISEFSQMYGSLGYSADDLSQVIATLPRIYYAILLIASEALALVTVLLSWRFCSLLEAGIRPMARLREWQLPPSLRLGLPMFDLAVAAAYLLELEAAETLLTSVLALLMPLFIAVGFCTALYFALRRRGGSGILVLAALMLILLSPYMTALVGLVDLYTGLRRRFMRTDRLIEEAFERAQREGSSTVTVDFGDGHGPQIIAVRRRREQDAFFDGRSEDGKGDPEGKADAGNTDKNEADEGSSPPPPCGTGDADDGEGSGGERK